MWNALPIGECEAPSGFLGAAYAAKQAIIDGSSARAAVTEVHRRMSSHYLPDDLVHRLTITPEIPSDPHVLVGYINDGPRQA